MTKCIINDGIKIASVEASLGNFRGLCQNSHRGTEENSEIE
jgi:hypothetical protein